MILPSFLYLFCAGKYVWVFNYKRYHGIISCNIRSKNESLKWVMKKKSLVIIQIKRFK